MYLAGKDAALFFARGQKFLEAFKQDEEYFMKNISLFSWTDKRGEYLLEIKSLRDLENVYHSEVFQHFLGTSYFCLFEYLSDYLSGSLYEAFIMPHKFIDIDSKEWREWIPSQDEDERDLMTDCLMKDFKDTEFVKINMMPTNEDLDKIARWIYGGVKKSLSPDGVANNILNELSYKENELVAVYYECDKQIISPYYVRLHNLEVKLKGLFLKGNVSFGHDWEFGLHQHSKRFSVWEIPKSNSDILVNGVYGNLAVENKECFYKEIKNKLRGFKGYDLAAAIFVMVSKRFLRAKPSTRILQLEFEDKTTKQYFDKCYRLVSSTAPPEYIKTNIEYWENYLDSLIKSIC